MASIRSLRRRLRKTTRRVGQRRLNSTKFERLEDRVLLAATPYRVNAGGGFLPGTPGWTADLESSPSQYVNASSSGNLSFANSAAIDMSDPSIPIGTPAALFQTERWDPSSGAEMQWDFPVTAGQYEVRLYFAEIYSGAQSTGARVFDVSIEGISVLNDYDIFEKVGGYKAVMESFVVTSDANLDIDFARVVENPAIKGIEIIELNVPNVAPVAVDDDLVRTAEGTEVTFNVLDGSQTTGGTPDSDVDGTLVPATVRVSGAGVSNGTLVNNQDGTFSYTPAPGFTGVDTFSYVVDDNEGDTSNEATVTITVNPTGTGTVSYRVNAGGDSVAGSPDWEADFGSSPSPYVNSASAGNLWFSSGAAIDLSHPSIPTGTPESIFQSERWDPLDGAEMQWTFPVLPGVHEVRLYFAEVYSGALTPGARVFDVSIEGTNVLDNYDVYAEVGGFKGIMESFIVTSDENLEIELGHVTENPSIKAIEIILLDSIDFPPVAVDDELVSTIEGTTVTFNVLDGSQSIGGESDGDVDGTLVPSTVSVSGAGVSSGTLINNLDGTFDYTPNPGFTGVDSFSYTVDDNDGQTSNLATVTITVNELVTSTVSYRVNAGGGLIADSPDWAADSGSTPSPYVNHPSIGNLWFGNSVAIDLSDPSLPTETPESIFQAERWDPAAGAEMQWDFPVSPGLYEVRLYFAEIYAGAQSVGSRVFDVLIEDATVLSNYDVFAEVGGYAGVMESFVVTSDANLDIDFGHVTENPSIKAIEILALSSPNTLEISASQLPFEDVPIGSLATGQLELFNLGGAGAPSITVTGLNLVGGNGAFTVESVTGLPVEIPAGGSATLEVGFTPRAAVDYTATLQVEHSGKNNPAETPLLGNGSGPPIAFDKSALANTSLSNPTSLQFGPDGRLYVAEQNGTINAYTINRSGPQNYEVAVAETINLIKTIPNHNDDGSLNAGVTDRLITGILVVGTAETPVIYVTSSDPRVGAGPSGFDLDLDTNSGVVSRLTWNGNAWEKLDLVRGLSRSEENHANNGLQLDEATNTLYVAIGGNTNMGAPSNNFALLPEYALSAAILSIDLDAIGETTYDLPTLDDEDRPGTSDLNDPFGGNDGKNQAKLVPGGPVQVHAPGFRNPYDLLITESGRMYSVDNGPNAGWGGVPVGEGPDGNATNEPSEPGESYGDGLHFITGAGYYGGHPNPTRSNPDNTFNSSNPQSPVSIANPIESDYQAPQPNTQGQNLNGALLTFGASTGGLTEYTASNFAGQLIGHLLLTSFDNTVKRIELNGDGDQVLFSENLFSSVGAAPLDVTTQGDFDVFPGTIWVADYITSSIYVFEPNETTGFCPGDDDCDGYTNEDEDANGTNPKNPGDVPPDWDQDFTSNLLDPDDDNDTIVDTIDPFAIDPNNGLTTPIGTMYSWENTETLGGLLNLGFTGLMTNGVDDYETLYDPSKLTAGGAAGVLTLDESTAGTALNSINTQESAYQFGFNAGEATSTFTAMTSLLSPFSGLTPNAGEQAGMFLGTGDQDNYVQLAVTGTASGQIQLQLISEFDATATTLATSAPISASDVEFVELFLSLDPTTDLVEAWYEVTIAGIGQGLTQIGAPIAVPATWAEGAMAVGVIATDPSPESPVPFTWDFLGVESFVPGGGPPEVDAGPDTVLSSPSLSTVLNADVVDDSSNGVPLRTVWNLVSGPAEVSFDDPYAVDTSVSFIAAGSYLLRLTADNGNGIVSDERLVTVLPSSGGLAASVDVFDTADQRVGTLTTNPLDPGDIQWAPISISQAQVNNFPGSVDGTSGSPATGTANFFYDASTNLLNYSITYAGLTSDLTNIHIHGPANAGESNMAHIFDVFSSVDDVINAGVNRRSDTIVGSVNLTSHTHGGGNPTPTLAEALAALGNGQAYVNIHSEAFPMGEIRGNVPAAVAVADSFFDLGILDTTELRFEPSFVGEVASVRYELDGVEVDVDNLPGDGWTWFGTTGDHVLVVTPYSEADTNGVEGPAYTVRFSARSASEQTRLAAWQPIASAPYPLYEGQGAAVDGKLYMFGGFVNGALEVTTEAVVYDPTTNSWSSIADAPIPLTHGSHAVDGDKIYVLGGYVGSHPGGSTNQVWIYDTVTDTWIAGPSLPEDRGGGGAAILDRKLYFYGGATRTQGDVASAVDHPDTWVLELGATDAPSDDGTTWTALADLPMPRNHMAGVSVSPYLYAIGGQFKENEFTGNSDLVHRYDPANDVWTEVARLPIEIGHITASSFASGGRIFVVTGVTENSTSTDKMFMYDPETDTWSLLPAAAAAVQSPIAAEIDQTFYMIGGDIGGDAYALELDDSWSALNSMPVALGEVAAGVVGDQLYVVGEGSSATIAYDLGSGQWTDGNGLATRPFAGGHHAAEVIDGKLYLFGGLGAGSEGKVQVYDPSINTWTLGADIPFATGSAATALIGGKVYLAGGIVGGTTTTQAAVYDPATDVWQPLAPMIDGVNHAAAATDGSRFYLFGGRTGGNVVSNGFDFVQVYDPLASTWSSSSQGFLEPLPEPRGGTGKAVYLNGDFYIFGGETGNRPAATAGGTYDRVDIYRPSTNTWRLGVPMPTARHGIFPVEHAGVVYLAGGGTFAGFGQSNLLEAYYVDAVRAATTQAGGPPLDALVLLAGESSSASDFAIDGRSDPLDINRDGRVTALDSLMVINSLGQAGLATSSDGSAFSLSSDQDRLDVNGDGRVTSLDALVVVNALARERQQAEAESTRVGHAIWNPIANEEIHDSALMDFSLVDQDEELLSSLAMQAARVKKR